MKNVLALLLTFLFTHAQAQRFITKDIKFFGARGDGKTNDHEAFLKAADYFNKRGGHGKLFISKGIYIVGRQTFTAGKNGKSAYEGSDVLHLNGVQHFSIEGETGALIKYTDGLRFGAFDPTTGKPYDHGNNYFVKAEYAAIIGHCIFITAANDVIIKNIELDGNNQKIILGGVYGDVGRQLPHYGIFIENSRSVTVAQVKAHHFALDGICVANKASTANDDIKLLNSAFTYNSRQGFSWIGGNDLKVKGCQFGFTGQSNFSSAPGAGVDIEAEYGPIRNGKFEDCTFIDNSGCGLVADSGDSGNCDFKNCTFWGLQNWSVWVTKPSFTFKDCKIYGSFVHGYNAPDNKTATKFKDCYFEDKAYNGKEAFGNFLVETNGIKRLNFEGCTFVANKKKLIWFETRVTDPEEKYQFKDCNFIINNTNLPKGDFVAVIRGMRYKNCTFTFTSKDAKQKGYYLNDCCEKFNTDAGGNKVIYAQ